MEDNLVSVIMPMYNSEDFLSVAIDSVIAQSYKSWELLIIDDGSTDKSINIARAYEQKDNRIHLLFNDTHLKNPSAPRNVGIERAKGQYIAFLDSDDCWLQNKLERQISLFKEKSNVAIVFSDYEKIDEHGNRRNRIVKAPLHVSYKEMLHCNYIGNLTGIYNRKVVGTKYLPNIHHEDYALWLNILKEGFSAYNTGTVEALYRIRESSVSSKKLHISSWQ